MPTALRFLVIGLMAAAVSGAQERSVSSNPPVDVSVVDRAWLDLKALATPEPPVAAGRQIQAPSADERNARRRQMSGRFQNAATRAKEFQEAFPDDPRAREARQLEAKSLLAAAMAGDNSKEGYASTLVSEVRSDARLSAKLRLEVVALAEIVRLRQFAPDRKKFLSAHEESARSLIMEFPQESGGYESLLRQAESHPDDAEAVRIARDLEKMPAPQSIKSSAQFFLDRQALVGRSLVEIADAALGKANPLSVAEGQGMIIYTWTVQSPGSIVQAKNLLKLAGGSSLVGINLDQDTAAAKVSADENSLPGLQIYDARGRAAPLVQALKLTSAFHVYVVDRQGLIQQVSAERGDLMGKLASAKR